MYKLIFFYTKHYLPMEIYIPFDIWCEISYHIPAGDLDMIWRFRLISRDSNRAVETLLNHVTTIKTLNSLENITINGVRHGLYTASFIDNNYMPSRFSHIVHTHTIKQEYYYGILHGGCFTKITDSYDYNGRYDDMIGTTEVYDRGVKGYTKTIRSFERYDRG